MSVIEKNLLSFCCLECLMSIFWGLEKIVTFLGLKIFNLLFLGNNYNAIFLG